MRKLLYTTTALVGAAFLMEAAPAKAEVSLSASYGARMVFGKVQERASDETKAKASKDARSSRLLDSASVTFSGSKDHPNGLTTGFTAVLDVDNATNTNNEDNIMGDVFGSVGGSFGTVYIGNVGDAGSHVFVGGTPGTAHFGVGSDHIGDPGIGTNATDSLFGREKSIKYASPSFTGFSFAVSYAPETGVENGRSDGEDNDGDYNDAFAVGVAYSNEFAGTSISLSGSFAQTDSQPKTWAAGDKTFAYEPTGGDADDFKSTSTVADPTGGFPDKVKDEDGSAFSFGASVGYQDFTFGGSWGQREQGTTETTAWRVGGSYAVDAFTFGVGYGQEEAQSGAYVLKGDAAATSGNIGTTTMSYSGTAGPLVEEESLAFTVDYALGDGAKIDFGIEVDETTTTEYVRTTEGAGRVKATDYDETIFGVGVSLSF